MTLKVSIVSDNDYGNLPYCFLLCLYVAARRFTISRKVTMSSAAFDCSVERIIFDGRCDMSSDALRLHATFQATAVLLATVSARV
jgi:hypothetical protein